MRLNGMGRSSVASAKPRNTLQNACEDISKSARTIKQRTAVPTMIAEMTNTKLESNRRRILRVQLYIEEHLGRDLPLDELAKVAHLSSYHFHRIFRATVGEGVAEYVRRIKLERAAIAIKAADDSVTNIAFDAGYGSLEAFTRAFRRQFGVSPSEFRKGHISKYAKKDAGTQAETKGREIRTEILPSMRVAFLRHTGPYQEVGATFQEMMGWAFSKDPSSYRRIPMVNQTCAACCDLGCY